ncbi:hypothetical protein Bealeia1_00650 [Candidatus Bealeia paramacronuclearis]|uniref:Integrase catalytic domain-containing protein n=1 Tax=Candidatus Bealeia paramacronuclearis TaxID=1921001 RepID=A0ABZ2C2K8_9PROT|nr:hypothetical protein [Candidatus Bealeia paramacronuclearis]
MSSRSGAFFRENLIKLDSIKKEEKMKKNVSASLKVKTAIEALKGYNEERLHSSLTYKRHLLPYLIHHFCEIRKTTFIQYLPSIFAHNHQVILTLVGAVSLLPYLHTSHHSKKALGSATSTGLAPWFFRAYKYN